MSCLVWKCVGIRVLVAVIVAVVVVVVVSYECGATNAAVVPHRLSRPLILPLRPPTTLHEQHEHHENLLLTKIKYSNNLTIGHIKFLDFLF